MLFSKANSFRYLVNANTETVNCNSRLQFGQVLKENAVLKNNLIY